jgi:glyoxylase-like metal-dependent hydrolase (beta-lactamase superfamily II)
VQRQGGYPILDLTVDSVEPNSSAALEFRGNPERGGGAAGRGAEASGAARTQSEKIGNGIWALNYGGERSIAVEFKDHVVIVEAPGGDGQSLATMAEVKRILPGKPIQYVVNTHHHSDHAAGIRAYAAEGIPIITHESHKRYYEQEIFKNPHTLNPDRLARMPRSVVIETVRDKRILSDGDTTLEIYLARVNLHSEGLLMVYVPKEKLLIQADMFVQRPGAPPLPAPSPFTTNLVENVERLKLDVQRVAHIHGGVDSWGEILKASAR